MGEGEHETDLSRMDRLVLWMLDKPWRSALVLAGLVIVIGGGGMRPLVARVDRVVNLALADEWTISIDSLVLLSHWKRLFLAFEVLNGVALGLAACVWTIALAGPRLWRRVTAAAMTLAIPSAAVIASAAWGYFSEGEATDGLVVLGRAGAGTLWITVGAVSGAALARLVPRGCTGRRFRLLVLLAIGTAALGPIVPIIVYESPLDGGGERYLTGWTATAIHATAALLWSLLWVRRGHAWWGWWGFAVGIGLVFSLGGETAREWYTAEVRDRELYWDSTNDLFLHHAAWSLAIAPFLTLARRADGLTMIPSDHPVRDGLRPDGTRVPVREFRRTRPLPPPPTPSDVPEPRAAAGEWGFSPTTDARHGRWQFLVAGALTALPIAVAESWLKYQFVGGRASRPYRRALVVLVLATVVWAIVQRKRHGPRYHPVWMVWGLVGGLFAWALLFKSHWF